MSNTDKPGTGWVDVPGTRAVRLYSLIMKPSVSCSNSYVLDAAGAILIIDPGTSDVNTNTIINLVDDLKKQRERPVYILLTHGHIDHYLKTPELQRRFQAQLVCHEACADIIVRRDRNASIASHFAVEAPDCGSVAHLDSPSFSLGGGDELKIYHTPGHTGGCVCFQVGCFFFTGDLLFAANPGVAGVPGWNRKALLRSVDALLESAERHGGVDRVFPGHGNPISRDDAVKLLHRARKQASVLPDAIPMDKRRVDNLSAYAMLLLAQAAKCFAITTGQVLKATHYFESRNETEAARRIQESFDDATLDSLVDGFHKLSDAYGKGKGIEQSLILLGAIQVADKLDRLLAAQQQHHVVGFTYLQRTRRMMAGFINAVYGHRYTGPGMSCNLQKAVDELIGKLKNEWRSSADADVVCIDDVIRRISASSLYDAMAIESHVPASLTVDLEEDDLQDLLSILMEQLALLGVRRAEFDAESSDKGIRLYIRTDRNDLKLADANSLRFIQQHIKFARGDFAFADALSFVFTLPMNP